MDLSKSEVGVGTRRRYSREYKREAVRLVTERGVTVAQAARDLGLHVNSLRKWVREQSADRMPCAASPLRAVTVSSAASGFCWPSPGTARVAGRPRGGDMAAGSTELSG